MASDRAAHVIAAGMREMARLHGMSEEEQRLIDEMEASLDGPPVDDVDLSALRESDERDAFLRSVVLVALADEERALAERWAAELGVDPSGLRDVVRSVASELLAPLKGVRLFRDQVIAQGQALGLSREEVEAILDG